MISKSAYLLASFSLLTICSNVVAGAINQGHDQESRSASAPTVVMTQWPLPSAVSPSKKKDSQPLPYRSKIDYPHGQEFEVAGNVRESLRDLALSYAKAAYDEVSTGVWKGGEAPPTIIASLLIPKPNSRNDMWFLSDFSTPGFWISTQGTGTGGLGSVSPFIPTDTLWEERRKSKDGPFSATDMALLAADIAAQRTNSANKISKDSSDRRPSYPSETYIVVYGQTAKGGRPSVLHPCTQLDVSFKTTEPASKMSALVDRVKNKNKSPEMEVKVVRQKGCEEMLHRLWVKFDESLISRQSGTSEM